MDPPGSRLWQILAGRRPAALNQIEWNSDVRKDKVAAFSFPAPAPQVSLSSSPPFPSSPQRTPETPNPHPRDKQNRGQRIFLAVAVAVPCRSLHHHRPRARRRGGRPWLNPKPETTRTRFRRRSLASLSAAAGQCGRKPPAALRIAGFRAPRR
jgi:hypothetical protein